MSKSVSEKTLMMIRWPWIWEVKHVKIVDDSAKPTEENWHLKGSRTADDWSFTEVNLYNGWSTCDKLPTNRGYNSCQTECL